MLSLIAYAGATLLTISWIWLYIEAKNAPVDPMELGATDMQLETKEI